MEARNRRRLVLALALLVVALLVVLVRNRDFWFGTDDSAESEAAAPTSTSAPASVAKTTPAPGSAAPAASPVAATKAATASKVPVAAAAPAAKAAAAPAPAAKPTTKKETNIIAKADAAPAVAPPAPAAVPTTRTKLPPLEVEVVAGDTHRSLRAGSNAVLVEIPTHADVRAAKTFEWNPVTNAAELTRMPSDLPERVAQAEPASYPSLAKQMKVQGAVVLQAVVGADGGIKDLHVISGNPILVSAAVEAARQWRFAPYLQNGQPVETQAKIQVNFMIKVL
jgi:TonB family protein